MATRTTGEFGFANWEERPVGPQEEGGPRLAYASVTNEFGGGITAADTTCQYIVAYAADGSGTFRGLELLSGSVDGRRGTFVLAERGTFDTEGTVACAFEVVPEMGTGELTGLTGSGRYTAKQGEEKVAYTFDYGL